MYWVVIAIVIAMVAVTGFLVGVACGQEWRRK